MDLEADVGATTYGEAFFAGIEEGARRSADIIAPLLLELFRPKSVVDVGGGGGLWGAAFLARGVPDVLTVDGPWVPTSARAVPPERFLEHDLSTPLALDRTFDLALCLEAAEHLPPSAAPELVRTLTAAAPVVVFSAALPGQGGDGHANEQPPSYWARLFQDRDYECFPNLRRRAWDAADIEPWYRQNLLCFVRRSETARWRPVLGAPAEQSDGPLDIAHPELLARHKHRGDQLEAYARRLEGECSALREELEATRRSLRSSEAELERRRADANIVNAALGSARRLAAQVGRRVGRLRTR